MENIQDASASSGPAIDDPDAASIKAAMRVPVTVMLGPMGTLLRKLHWLMAPGQSLAPDLLRAEEVSLLSDGLKKLCISLKNMSEDEDPSFMVQWWMKIVRELCYDTEDHLDEVCRAGTHHDFSELLARVEDASESRQCFQWSPPKTIKPADLGETSVSRRTSLELPVPLPVHVEPPNKLVELLDLHDDGKTLKVIPITGCAGVGKTTAARALYHRHGGKFHCQAFVTVSRNPDMRGFLTRILSQLKAPRPHGYPDVPDLIDAIHKHLQGKRYFIVVDDLWTSSVWNIISRAFPRGDYCSRIITTTQIDDVALACCSYDPVYIYKMFPLNDPESRKLFFGIVFGSEDRCPIDIKEVSYDIVKKCCGLPLAVVNIARLLASEPNIVRERWEHIQDSLPSTSEEMMDVLNLLYNILPLLMYNSLPPRLRTCLLYLGMYTEGHVIKKDELVKLWVTESFLSAVGGRNTQEIAEGYFDELVGRGMVQAVDINNNGEVLSCTVHQMVLDFIRLTSVEENFVINVDCFQSTLALPDKVRRLSIQFGGVKGAYIPESIITSQVRSLIFWGFFKCVPSIMDCRLLRILILCIWGDEDNESFDLTGIGDLFLLKYLEIECNITAKLPEKDNIPWLQHLETLQVDARLSAVPSDIINMKRLLHLRLPSEYILPSIVAQMTSLRTLGYFDVSSHTVGDVLHLGELTNLQDLQLTCSTVQPAENLERNMQLLGSILEKLTVLQSLTLVPAASDSSCVNIPKDGFNMACPPPDLLLQRIELSRRCCIFFSLPNWFGELMKLRILKIAISKLSMNDADMLKGLPALTALTLYIQTPPTENIVIDKGGFQVLTYFKFMCVVPCMSFVPGAMPRVQKLKIGFNYDQWRSYTFGKAAFIYLTGLKEVSIKLGIRHANNFNTKGVESTLEAAVKYHPNTTLLLTVQYVDVISYGEEIKSTTTKAREEKIHEIREGKKKITERSEEQDEIQHKITERSDEPVNKPSVNSRYASTDRVSTPLKHHARSIDVVVMGTMGSLLPKLLELLKDRYNLEAKVKHRVMSLHKDMEGLRDTLQLVATLEQLDDDTQIWAGNVRDLSYDVEDVIDSLRVRVEGSRGGKGRFITWFAELLSKSKSKAHHVFANAIGSMIHSANYLAAKGRMIHSANYLATEGEKFRMRFDGSIAAANQNAAYQRMYPLYEYQDNKVDIDVSVIAEVMEKLTRKTGDVFDQLSIVSIVGMGGLGKTTLARSIYEKMWQYDCRAFIRVSRDRDMRRVYKDILFQIGESRYMDNELAIFDENQLIDKVRRLLANKRYLIVFDDVWDVNLWEAIKVALVDDGLGSRVVTTTRILDVAQTAGEVYKLKALSAAQSKVLFKAIFPYGEEDVPNIPREALVKILSKCGGVPLAINTMARLLARNLRVDLSNVLDVGGNAIVWEETRQILSSSYYDMPYHLRACLLHLHIFPEDWLIKKETLIWKWAAEGLIVEEPGIGLFEIGEGYLKELINRNVVMPVEDESCSGEVTGCRVHFLVLDMICSLSTMKGFVTVLDGSMQHRRIERWARRLAVQKRAVEQGDHRLAFMLPEGLIRSFNTMGCHFGRELSLTRFELLRVLAIEECTLFKGSLSHIGNLLLLRYLGLYNTPIDELPEETGDLIYLQTLDLRGTRICKLPDRVAQLRQLKCLRADEHAAVPHRMGNLTSLEELRVGKVSMSGNFATELGKLTELRELEFKIERFDDNSNKALVESMSRLQGLQVLRLNMSSLPGEEANWEGFLPPRRLRDLRMKIASSGLPAWINRSLVPCLSHLSVEMKAVEEQNLEDLGRLPELISLELLMPSDVLLGIKVDGSFRRLRYFCTSAPVRFLPGAMPCLESFRFKVHAPDLTAADFDFASLVYLRSLWKVQVEIASSSNVEVPAVYKALKRAVDKHPNRPRLHLITPDQVDTAHQRPL